MGRWIDFKNDYKTMEPWYMESVRLQCVWDLPPSRRMYLLSLVAAPQHSVHPPLDRPTPPPPLLQVWWVFKTLWEKGLVYRSFKVMPYSTACNTPLSNFEAGLNYKEDTADPAGECDCLSLSLCLRVCRRGMVCMFEGSLIALARASVAPSAFLARCSLSDALHIAEALPRARVGLPAACERSCEDTHSYFRLESLSPLDKGGDRERDRAGSSGLVRAPCACCLLLFPPFVGCFSANDEQPTNSSLGVLSALALSRFSHGSCSDCCVWAC
jgi:hypothetical protein